jgi:hypothetical protein
MTFMEDMDGTCEGCRQRVEDLHDHQRQCQMWHMRQVINKKNQRRKPKGEVVPDRSIRGLTAT